MNDFINITAQRVKHKSGYEVYSAGRDFIGYDEDKTTYRIRRELGWGDTCGKGVEIIYTNDIYDKNGTLATLSTLEREVLIDKIVSARKFSGNFEIQISP